MQDASVLSQTDLEEIAGYIKRDNLAIVNQHAVAVKPRVSFYTRYGKRLIDILVSGLALIVTAPINLVIAIVTIFDVGMPIIFKQSRIGKDLKPFTIYKFRNMTNAKDANGELLPPHQRVTKWGKFVRKTSLDELLNFVSIFNGSMSLIGPRPLLNYYAGRLNNYHKSIYLVKPGLECPPINKVDHALSWQERLDTYVWYVENCSFLVDMKLAFRIVQMALDRKSTAKRSGATHGGVLGYAADGSMIYSKQVPDQYIAEFCKMHGFNNLEEAVKAREEHYHDVKREETVGDRRSVAAR